MSELLAVPMQVGGEDACPAGGGKPHWVYRSSGECSACGESVLAGGSGPLLAELAAEANRPESLAARRAATAEAEAEFLADLDAEALTIEHAMAGDRVEVVTGAGFLTVTVDKVGGVRHGWASVTYHHDNGFSMTRRLLCSTPVSRPVAEATR